MHWRRKWQPTPVFCLENPRDGGAWWAAVYGVAQSRTRMERLSSSSSSTVSWSLLKFMSIESVMPSNHLFLCAPFSSCLLLKKKKKNHSYYCKVVRPVWPPVCRERALTHSCWAEFLPVALYQSLLRWSRGSTPSSHLVLLLRPS